jgi:hypothetical protein
MFVLLLTYTLLSMTDFNQLGPIVAYNAQGLRKPGRFEHILGEFQHVSIVCINGTRWKAKDDIPVELYHIRGFLVYSAGYGKSSNRHEARAIQGTKKGSKRRWGNAPMTSVPTVAQNKHLLQKPAQQGGWSAQVYREDVTETKRTGVHGFTKGVLESSFGESPKEDVAEKDIDDEIEELRRTVKREKNSKVVPFWDCPMEMLKLLMHPQTVYRRVAWGLGHEKQFKPPRSFYSPHRKRMARLMKTPLKEISSPPCGEKAHLRKTPPQKETSPPPCGDKCYDLDEEQLLDLDPTPVWTPVALDQDEDEFVVKENKVGSAKENGILLDPDCQK